MSLLPDLPARLRALTDLESTLLIEAAAGTGKTALIAGRVTVCLIEGVDPEHVAAITFNELAASELSARIHDFVSALLGGKMPECLRPAFPQGLSAEQRARLMSGAARIDALTITTLHGFCQRLIHSYAVESDIDPGARMMDAPESDAAFELIFQQWLRERLTRPRGPADPIASMSERDPLKVEAHLRALARFRRRHRTAKPVHADLSQRLDRDFEASVMRFSDWLAQQPREEETHQFVGELTELADFYRGCLESRPDFVRLWHLAHPPAVRCRRGKTLNLVAPRRRSAWQRLAGRSEGTRLSDESDALFARVNEHYCRLIGAIAIALVETLSAEIDEMLEAYALFKRRAAVLDFDDLLHRARALVRDHEAVRVALGQQYRHILIDEFQDTDPIQAETLFRIAAGTAAANWQDCVLRPGALFMVGDPKQAIYRFRGADVRSYRQARAAIERDWPTNILQITANFRSVPGVIDYVNTHFDTVLDAPGQPGYVALTAVRAPDDHGLPCVAKRTLDLPHDPKVHDIRDAEAHEVAALCEQLIGNLQIRNAQGALVPAAAGDIALLAPTSTHLWRYERALEARGLPLASNAGKGLLRRQEVQDLIALARTLADATDTLAFGALLRGPLVGLTEDELLEITASLGEDSDKPAAFTIRTDPDAIAHPLARQTLIVLRDLRRRAYATTPSLLLAEAIERLAVRAILYAREGNERARAATNIERFVELARSYDVGGLKRFAQDITKEWESGSEERTEGRVDAEGAIELVTMHSSKGLEWPVVILINTCSQLFRRSEFVHRPDDDTVHWLLGEIEPPELTRALRAEDIVSASERQRVLYVACTRARELLVIPELPPRSQESWAGVVDNTHVDVPELKLSHFKVRSQTAVNAAENEQSAELFEQEAAAIRERSQTLRWRRPSDDDPDRLTVAPEIVVDGEASPETPAPIGAGRVRGLILHKLIEEVLTGESAEEGAALTRRAEALLEELTPGDDTERTARPRADELAQTVLRTLLLPEIAAVRARLVPEVALYGLEGTEGQLTGLAGRADAMVLEGKEPEIVIDWKSDVAPEAETTRAHATQLRDYLRVSGARRGALVYMTSGLVRWVE